MSTTVAEVSPKRALQYRVFQIMDIASSDDPASKWFDRIFLSLIMLNVAAFMLETVDDLYKSYELWFTYFEYFSVAVFTGEFLIRIWTAPANPRAEGSKYPHFKLFKTPMFLIDFLAILPFYLSFLGLDLRALRIIRLAKVFRYSSALQMFMKVFAKRAEELILSIIIMFILILIAAVGIFYTEHSAQPLIFSSIPASMWWAVETLTTIGYGEIYPITPLGKLFATIVSILGIGMIALPTSILGAGFIDEIQSKESELTCCPHCQKSLKDYK